MVQQKSDDKLTYVELRLFQSTLLSIVAVGLHADRALKGSITKHLSAREAISYSAISTLPLLEFGRCCQLDVNVSSEMIAKANTNMLCGGICCRLASLVGTIAKPSYVDICLCGIINKTSPRLENEYGAFAFDDALSLQRRSIFLAAMCPVASVSDRYDPTLSLYTPIQLAHKRQLLRRLRYLGYRPC